MKEIFETLSESIEVPQIRFTTTKDNKVIFNAITSQGNKISDYLGRTIDVTAIVVTDALVNENYNDSTSPKVHKPSTHFFTKDKEHISTMSTGVIKLVKSLIEMNIMPNENGEPLSLTITQKDTKKGKCYSFEL